MPEYTPPGSSSVDISLSSYTVPSKTSVDFELGATTLTQVATAKFEDGSGTAIEVPLYDPADVSDVWLRFEDPDGGAAVCPQLNSDPTGYRLRVRRPTDDSVWGVETA